MGKFKTVNMEIPTQGGGTFDDPTPSQNHLSGTCKDTPVFLCQKISEEVNFKGSVAATQSFKKIVITTHDSFFLTFFFAFTYFVQQWSYTNFCVN